MRKKNRSFDSDRIIIHRSLYVLCTTAGCMKKTKPRARPIMQFCISLRAVRDDYLFHTHKRLVTLDDEHLYIVIYITLGVEHASSPDAKK